MQEELRLPLTGNMSGFGVPLAHQSASFIRGVKNNAYFFKKCSNKSVGTGLNCVQVVPSYVYFKRHDDTHALKSCQQS